MRKLLSVALIYTLAACTVNAQVPDISMSEEGIVHISDRNFLDLNYVPEAEIKEYLDDEWSNTQILYPNGTSKFFEQGKYNVLQNRLEMVVNEDVIFLLPGIISGFTLEREGKINHLVLKVSMDVDFFMDCLSAGKLNLLVHREKPKEERDIDMNSNMRFELPESQKVNDWVVTYYAYPVKNDVEKLKRSKKSILKLMEDKSGQVEKYIDENRLDTGNLADLKQIFDFYNSL